MALEPAAQLENHPRVELDGDNGLDAGLEQPLGEISRSGPDLEDGVGGLEAGLGDDGVHERRVPQDVLALGLLERDPTLQPRATAPAAAGDERDGSGDWSGEVWKYGKEMVVVLGGSCGRYYRVIWAWQLARRAQGSGHDSVFQLDRIRTCSHASRCIAFSNSNGMSV